MRADVATGELLNPEVANLVRCRSRDAMEDVVTRSTTRTGVWRVGFVGRVSGETSR